MTRWTSRLVVLGALLAAGCSQIITTVPPNPCVPPGMSESEAANVPTPHLVSMGTWQGYRVVCE